MTTRRELEALRVRLDEAAKAYCYRSRDPFLQWLAASADASAQAEYRTRWPGGWKGTVEELVVLVRAENAAGQSGCTVRDGPPVAELQHRGGRHGA